MSFVLCFTSDIMAYDQNWDHLYSSSAGGKDLFSDNQVRVIGSMKPEIFSEMLRNLSEKLAAKFHATTLSCIMVRITRLKDAFSDIFELEPGPVEGQSLLREH